MKKITFFVFLALIPLAAQENQRNKLEKILADSKVQWNFVDVPFVKVIDFLRSSYNLNLVVDRKILQDHETEGTRINLQLDDLSLRDALELFLDIHHLAYRFSDGVFFITSKDSPLLQPDTTTVLHEIRTVSLDKRITQLYARRLRNGIWLPYSPAEEAEIRSHQEGYSYIWHYDGIVDLIRLLN